MLARIFIVAVSLLVATGVLLVVIGPEERETQLVESPTLASAWTIRQIHDSYLDIKDEHVRVQGFASMSAQSFWILNGMTRDSEDRMTSLSDTAPGSPILRLWLSWKDWTDNPGFEASGEITASCQVGALFWDTSGHNLDGVKLDDCELS